MLCSLTVSHPAPRVAVYPLLTLIAVLGGVQGQVTLTLSGSDSHAVQGGNFTFTCVQTGTPETNNLIFFQDSPVTPPCLVVLTSPCQSDTTCGCVSQSGNTRTHRFVLANVSTSDAGNWTCQFTGLPSLGIPTFNSSALSVAVYGVPTRPTLLPSSPVGVVGRDVTLTCSSSATTMPTSQRLPLSYSWFRGGSPVSGGTSGSLVVSPVSLADEASYTCRSREGSDRLTSELSSPSSLDVQYPPSSVSLVPANTSYEVRENTGSVPDIRCQADCDPPCSFQWTDKGGNNVGTSGSRLQLTSLNRQQAGSFRCTASNAHGNQSTQVSILVTYAPEVRVTPLPCGANNTYVTVVGTQVTLTCDVTAAYPNASGYEWSVAGSGWTTGARQYSVSVTKSSGGQYRCRTSNSVATSSASLALDVQYPPEVTVTETSVTVVEGHNVTLQCHVDARPDVTPVWTRVSGSLPPGVQASSPHLPLSHVTRNQSGLYVCNATNRLSPCDPSAEGERTASASIRVDVLYAPEVRVTPLPCVANNTYVTVVGTQVTLTCDVTAAYPNASGYKWSVPGSDWTTGARQYSVSVTKSSGGQYRCRTSNSVAMSSANLALDVQYPPEVTVTDTSVTVVEGHNVTLQCHVDARPDVTPVWTRVSGSLPPGVQGSSPHLPLSHVTRNQSGLYICSATNRLSPCDVSAGGERTASANVSVDVLYAPHVTQLSINSKGLSVTVEENANWTLRCDVTSNPTSTLRLLNVTSAQVLVEDRGTLTSQLRLSAACLHTGNYSCSAENLVTSTVSASPVQLFVTCSPRQDLRVHGIHMTLASPLGGRVTFTLPLVALPSPQHLWYRQDNSSQHVLSEGVSSSGLQASLSLSNVTQSHFGLYFLNISNEAGTADFTFELIPQGPPECPRLVSLTSDSSLPALNVSWERGFNGGGPQHFLVEVREGQDQWSNTSHNVTEISMQDRYSLSLDRLQPGRNYTLRVRAYNEFGHSCYSDDATKTTALDSSTDASPVPLIAGVVSSSVLLIVIIVVITIFIKRRKAKLPSGEPCENKAFTGSLENISMQSGRPSRQTSDDVLEDNILYESSQGLRAEAARSQANFHPILEDNPLYETSADHAPIIGNKKKNAGKSNNSQEGENVYAKVQKKTKDNLKKQQKQRQRGEAYENVEVNAGNTVVDNVYSNSTVQAHANSREDDEQNQEPSGPLREITDDGCVYITVESTGAAPVKAPKAIKPATAPKPGTNNQAYKDDSVIYSDIDHSKKAPSVSADDVNVTKEK